MPSTDNLILATDSYKLNHWNQYPEGTETVYSYLESRAGSQYDYTVFFGLQYILKRYLAMGIGPLHFAEARQLAGEHFGNTDYFNGDGWQHILNKHGGKLPLHIKAVPEGMVVPTGNVLMTVENTDPDCYWLTNAVESLLTHVWYSSNVATMSRATKQMIAKWLDHTADSRDGLDFMLHDFGYRGASGHESAGIGGAGHLVNFLGTDTLPAMQFARKYYSAPLAGLGYSVAATEHSIMTSLGPDGEVKMLDDLLAKYPKGILSVVSDSYDVYEFVRAVCDRAEHIKARDGVFVVRPDSITKAHSRPELLTLAILRQLDDAFGHTKNRQGYRVLDPGVRVLWGDGIDPDGIETILAHCAVYGYSASNLVFGMGGGLLQKHNRDTQRFAFKSSAQKRDGQWHDVFKRPIDLSKASKRGRLSLIEYEGKLTTVSEPDLPNDILQTVFLNGEPKNETTFGDVRARAALT